LPGGAKGSFEDVFSGFSEDDVGGSGFAPASVDGEENFGLFGYKVGLELGGEHDVAIAFCLMRQGGEDAIADAEIGVAHVGGFFGSREGQGESAEVGWGHGITV